ncbi:MAG: hypothetical protein LBT86_00120 [Deltaproteobacteria bacterium]|jgi:hypothetical protein|nr:hypothetical protein [Deltaproteobacteria bacterium]
MSDPERDNRLNGDETFDIDIEGFDDLNFHEMEREMEEATDSSFVQGRAMDLELERLLQRLDKVVAPSTGSSESGEPDLVVDHESAPPPRFQNHRPIPRPPQVARPVEPMTVPTDIGQANLSRANLSQASPSQASSSPANPSQASLSPASRSQASFSQSEPPEVQAEQAQSPQHKPSPPNTVRSQTAPASVEAGAILLTDRLSDGDQELDAPISPVVKTAGAKTVSQLTPQQLSDLIERAVEKGVRQALAARKPAK